MKDKTTFLELSLPLRVGIILAYFTGIIYSFLFVVGVIVAMTEGF